MSPRRYRLEPWLVHALIPETVRGVYVLWSPTRPVQLGRGLPDLRTRLLEHAVRWPDIFFTYDVAIAFDDEVALEQLRLEQLAKHLSTPDRPNAFDAHQPGCPFCARDVDVGVAPTPLASVPA